MIICQKNKCKHIEGNQCSKGNTPDKCTEYKPDECIFYVSGKGKCAAKTVDNSDYCQEHNGLKCVVCGNQAYLTCLWKVVDGECGALLCKNNDCFRKHLDKEHNQ